MAIHSFGLTAGRLNKFKGQTIKHAVAMECLARDGRQVRMPKNNSDTYVARQWLPYKATSTNQNTRNRFFTDGTGDRTNVIVQENQTQEGVTPGPESLTPVDVTVVLLQYSCLYGYTDKAADLYEDDIPREMVRQVGERVAFVNEMIIYGALKGSLNQFYGGTGTSIATVNGAITINFVRKIAKNLMANHAQMVNSMLKAGPDYGTDPVAAGFNVYCSTDMEHDIRDLPGFTPVEKYSSGTPMPYEVGKVERFRFICSPDLVEQQDAGAAVGATGLESTSGSNINVYRFIVCARDAWSQVAVRGMEALSPTFLPTGMKSKSDPHGQRGYVGTCWWKAALVENDGWLAVGNVGINAL